MKKLLIGLLAILPVFAFSQTWMKDLPAKKANDKPTMIEIQTAFNKYCETRGVVNGKVRVDDRLVKEPNWKRFKRWEWYWESRVSRSTGAFPDGKQLDNYYRQINRSVKNSKGNWKALGPSVSDGGYAGIGRINCVAFHPDNNDVFWVGSPSGGLWQTLDGGNSWTVLTDNNAVLGVSDIVVAPDYESSKTIYIATGDRDGGSVWTLKNDYSKDNNSIGVLKSTDGGLTWQTTGLSYNIYDNKVIGRLLMHPENKNILYAGTSDGISKSTDGGGTWATVYKGEYVIDMEIKPNNPDVLYASTKDYWEKPKILLSVNAGGSWATQKEFAESDYRIELAVTDADAEYIYAVVANDGGGLGGIYRSVNSGTSFSQLVDGNDNKKSLLGYYSDGSGDNSGQGGYDLCIAASPTDKNTVFIGGINTWKSTDGGSNWLVNNMWTSGGEYNKSGAQEVHADKHALKFRTNGDLFEANDGGIYISTNGGGSWVDISNGLVISQIYRLGVSQTNANMVISGLQDNGSKLVENTDWTDVSGGDGMECIIDYTQENTQYATYVNGEIYRTKDKWRFDISTISDNIAGEGGAWVTPYIIDPTDNAILYVGYADVWKTTNKGDSFTKISSINSSELLRSMAIAPSNSDVLYVADFGHIYKTINGGGSWLEVTNNLPVIDNSITYISVKSDDPSTLWVTMAGYNNKVIYESVNGGTNWTNISSGLPELPVLCVVQNSIVSPTVQLYAATDAGVYLRNNNEDWVSYSNGLPNVIVTELEIYYDESNFDNCKLRAATFGRGLWESSLTGATTTADFLAENTTVMVTDSVQFTDKSTNNPTSWEWTFQGGSPMSSTEQNPKINYDTVGTYNVKLVVTNSFNKDSVVKSAYITVVPLEKPIPDFEASKTEAYLAENIQFTDKSKNSPSAWLWTFDGGNPASSDLRNPVVSYAATGNYSVSLEASNTEGDSLITKVAYITVTEPPAPVAGFTANAKEIFAGEEIVFTDTSSNVPTAWQWYFEGGTPATSINQNPTIKYNTVGQFDVALVVTNLTGKDSAGFANYVKVNDVLLAEAKFTASPTSGSIPLQVVFTNNSLNATNYLWEFGDGNTSSEENPTHSYETDGSFTVKLTASNINNSSTEAKVDYITVSAAQAVANFTANPREGEAELEVQFLNNSSNASTYSWDFGDGSTSTEEEPMHVYENTGVYTVSLTASNGANSDTKEKANYITVNYAKPVANFEASPRTGIDPLTVEFTNLSENYVDGWHWDFGDGSTSIDENPSHVYSKGVYTVSLLVSNPTGNNLLTKESYISVDPNALPEALKEKLKVYPNPVNDVVYIDFMNDSGKPVEIELFDANGKIIEKVIIENRYRIKEQMNVEKLEAGNYLLRINSDLHIVVMNLLKE